MTLIAFIITSVKYHLKLLSAKFLLPMISLKWTLYNYILYGYTRSLQWSCTRSLQGSCTRSLQGGYTRSMQWGYCIYIRCTPYTVYRLHWLANYRMSTATSITGHCTRRIILLISGWHDDGFGQHAILCTSLSNQLIMSLTCSGCMYGQQSVRISKRPKLPSAGQRMGCAHAVARNVRCQPTRQPQPTAINAMQNSPTATKTVWFAGKAG